ncbi:hypothetical protein [Nocardia sp. X0981]
MLCSFWPRPRILATATHPTVLLGARFGPAAIRSATVVVAGSRTCGSGPLATLSGYFAP